MKKELDNVALTANYIDNEVTFNTNNHGKVNLLFDYTKGDETQLDVNVKFVFKDDAEADVIVPWTKPNEGTGAVEAMPDMNISVSGQYVVTIDKPLRAEKMIVSAKALGGTPTGTLTFYQEPDSLNYKQFN